MKTKIKRHSRAVISVILTLCMLMSCMTVGLIATDAAKVTGDESVGDTNYYLYYRTDNTKSLSGMTAVQMTASGSSYSASFTMETGSNFDLGIGTASTATATLVASDWTKSYSGNINFLNIENNGSTYYLVGSVSKKSTVTVTYTPSKTVSVAATDYSGGGTSSDGFVSGSKVYLDPGTNWDDGSAKFAAYFFNDTEDKAWSKIVDHVDAGSKAEITVPEGGPWANVILCRMKNTTTAGTTPTNWDNKWNQTNDLTYDESKNFYTVADDAWDKGNGTWSSYDPTTTVTLSANKENVNSGETVSFSVTHADTTNFVNFTDNLSVTSANASSASISGMDITFNDGGTFTVKDTAYYSIFGFPGITGSVDSSTVTITSVAEAKHAVTFTSSPAAGGSVDIPSGTEVGETTPTTITATPNAGYRFTGWTFGDGISGGITSDNPTDITTGGSESTYTVTANFEKVNLSVSAAADPADAATVAVDSATKQIGNQVTVTISDIDDKYTLGNVKYRANGADTNIDISNNTGSFTMPGYDTTVTASFNQKSGTLTVANEGTKGTTSYSSQTISSVTTTALPTVTAAEGYTFQGYLVTSGTVYGKGGNADTAFESTEYIPAGTAVNLRGNATVTAQYTLNSHELSWENVEGEHSFDVKIGEETINSGRSVDYGTTVNVTANGTIGSDYKYLIDTVTGVTLAGIEGEGTETLTGSFTMPDSNVTLGVSKRQAYQISILPISHGTLTVTSGGQEIKNGDFVVAGTTLNITLETDEGYRLLFSNPSLTKNTSTSTTTKIVYEGTLTVDSAETISMSLGAIPQQTVTVAKSSDKGTVTVSYTKNEKTVTKEAYTAPITVDNGTEVTVYATPTTDYRVTNINFNGTDNEKNSTTETSAAYTVNGEDVAATVSFAHIPVALYLGTESGNWGLDEEDEPFTDNGDGTFSYLTDTLDAGTYYVYVATTGAGQATGVYWKAGVDDKSENNGTISTTDPDPATVVRYDNSGNYGNRNGSFEFVAPTTRKYTFTFDPENLTLSVVGTIQHIKPEISFANGGTVNAGSSVILTVTNHNDNTALDDSTMYYEVKRGDETLTQGTDYTISNDQITILNPQSGSYTVKAKTTKTEDFADSEASTAATLTVYTPKFTLMGNVSSTDISNVTNSVESHDSTATRGWPKDDRVNDSVYYTGNSSVRVDGTTATPGVYTISFTTTSDKDSIDIGLYETSVGQTALDIDGFRPTVRQDYWVPSEGKTGIDIISNPEDVSSLKLKPGVTYTITINQITGKMDIASNAADCTVVARVITFNSNTGEYNSTPANATAAIGRATSAPSTGIGETYTSKLTATIVDEDNYTFEGWFDNADCTGTEISTEASYDMTVTVSEGDKVYYALFKQKTPPLRDVTVTTTGTGTVAASAVTPNGIHSGAGTEADPYEVYSGAIVRLQATPGSGYRLGTVTSTSGTVSVSGNYITITNVTADATVSVEFEIVPTKAVTVVADSSDYGKFTVEYIDANGVTQKIALTSTTQTFNAKEDTVVKVNATPNSNCNFIGWTMSGDYSRSKTTPLTAQEFSFKPTGTVTATAHFEASDITGDQITANYYIKVAKNKKDTYKINVPLYRTVKNSNNEFRSYFTIGDTDDPANGKLKVGENYWFIISSKSGDASISDSHYNANLSINKTPAPETDWSNNCKGEDESGKYAWLVNFKSNASKATMYWGKRSSTGQWNGWFDEESSKYYTAIDVTTNSIVTDDTPSTDGYTNLYVLDGTITRNNNAIQNYGTNTFGDSKIISSNSGVLKMNYYDAENGDEFIFSDDTHSEGQRVYWYDAAENLDFRVQTTIKSGHQAIGVRAFVMNGLTYPARKSANGVYYADITLEAGSNQGVLEVIPVYYNIYIPEEDYIKFYVDANTLGTKFGKTIGYSVWYNDTSYHGETGGYPGQPLMSDGNLLYGYFPRYWVDNNASATPDASNRSNKFAGVLLTNLSEHNYTHQDVLRAWGCDVGNYQSFDYEDPVAIADIDDVDMIEFVAKYKELATTHRTDYNSRTLNGNANKAWPSSISPRPTTAAAALEKGFEYLTDIDGKRVNIFNENDKTLNGDPIYVVSAGNQKVTPNEWDTVWEVYTADGNSIAAARPVDFINPTDELRTALSSYTNSPVLINYEGWLAGESNSGTRFDGRWLYSRSSDDTTLRLRVATKDASDNLTFMTDGINWAEINDGATNNGVLETADETNYTKILNLEDRITEVNAKINPIGYKVYGFYMLGAAYSGDTDNGFSSKLSDYDNLNVSGSATSFVNSKDNRMVIVVEKIPAKDLVVTHQLYLGEGAHKIPGFFTVKAEIIAADGTTVDYTYDFAKSLSLSGFTDKAPHGSNKTLRITLKSQMSGVGTSFNRWYVNDHNNGYDDVDSTEAHGKTGIVTKVIDLDVDDFYTVDEQSNTSLKFQNIDYYSDLQSAGSVNINHYLLKETTDLGLTGTTYVQTTVVTSDGTPVAGGSDVARITSDEVSSDFITVENAAAGHEIKIEIWTKATGAAKFDKFYKNTTTEMVTETDSHNDIYYSVGNTKTFNGEEYESAIVYVPINYFFKEDTNAETGDIIKVFDATKRNFDLYSALKRSGKYTIEYQYTSRLWKDQKYVQKGDITEDIAKYFTFDANGNPSALVAGTKAEFLSMMAPYEDNFMKKVVWKLDEATVVQNDLELSIQVASYPDPDDNALNCYLSLPYAFTLGGDKLTMNKVDNAGRPIKSDSPVPDKEFSATYSHVYTLNNSGTSTQFLYAAPVMRVGGTDQAPELQYFQYWNVYNADNTKFIRRCYFNEFNLTFYEAYRIEAVYGNTQTNPTEQSGNDGIKANISFLENSRNQWNRGFGGDASKVKSYWKYYGDRIFSDFSISFAYNDLLLSTTGSNVKPYLVIEQVAELNQKAGAEEGVKDTSANNLPIPASNGVEDAATYVSSNGATKNGHTYIMQAIDKSKIDNKNCIEYYYNFANLKQDSSIKNDAQWETVVDTYVPEESSNKNYLYRAYAVITDGTNTVASDPAYFTFYDMASIKNYAENQAKPTGGKS